MDIHYGRKRSGIKRELIAKVNDWLETITDEAVREQARANVIVTGGSICSMLLGDPVNDYDMYFRNKETAVAVAHYYVNKFNANNKLDTEDGVHSVTPFVKVDSIQQGTGNPGKIPGYAGGGAGAGAGGMAEISAGTGIHSSHKHDGARIGQGYARSGQGDGFIFNGLAQNLHCGAGKLGQLV